jgi:hypothetical protein
MMPIVPLDGGIILKKIILHKVNYKKTDKIMVFISCIFIGIILLLGLKTFWDQPNFSVMFLLIFIIGNIFTQKEKYNIDFIKELMFYQKKGKQYKNKTVRFIVCKNSEELKNIVMQFNIRDFFIVFLLNTAGGIDNIMTETEIMNRITFDKTNR